MGNCGFRGFGEMDKLTMIKVVTYNGGVMELQPPVTVENITNGFPGHGVFKDQDLLSKPLMHNEELSPGEVYHLRPLNSVSLRALPSVVAPYRVSFDQEGIWRCQDMDMHQKCMQSGGSSRVWKVKLVISPAQLSEILAHESRTEALIESVRMVAKCGHGSMSTSVASSDQWSLASSRTGRLEAGA
ncbi:Viral coat protein subunit protein [Dioscorea alata]|uniref:Viral coat protein subunit protein n=1 Tax=Dioscorea alata TaxID=55571 RepID=A0ACB7WFM2_DIOAL|nr:Viral coat protein subunit protein [Dioscorea alata]